MPKFLIYLVSLVIIILIFLGILSSFASKKNNQSQINNVLQEEIKEEEIKEEKKEEIKPEEIKNEENNLTGETTFLKVLFIILIIIDLIETFIPIFFGVLFIKKNCSSLETNKKLIIKQFLIIMQSILASIFIFLIRKEKKFIIILLASRILALCNFIIELTIKIKDKNIKINGETNEIDNN